MAEFITAPLEWFGINSFGDNAMVLRTRIKTVPGKQWAIGRAYNGYLKSVFDERGIEIPFPQQTIWLGEAKDGSTQRFRIEDASMAAGARAQSSFGIKTEQGSTKPKENDTEASEDESTNG